MNRHQEKPHYEQWKQASVYESKPTQIVPPKLNLTTNKYGGDYKSSHSIYYGKSYSKNQQEIEKEKMIHQKMKSTTVKIGNSFNTLMETEKQSSFKKDELIDDDTL